MFKFLAKTFKIRTSELEAKLRPAEGHSGWGEVELSEYSDGSFKMEVEYKNAGIQDGEKVDVIIGGRNVAYAMPSGGCIFEWLRGESGSELPGVSVGDTVELSVGGETLASGVFHPD